VDATSVFIMFLAIAFFGVIAYLATASRRARDAQVQAEQHSSERLESERREKAA
jgi:Flp pilus assembly protein CpaB